MDKEVENNNMGSHQTDHFAPLEMVDYMLCNNPSPQPQISLDKLSFADVMQFADFGPKLALMNQPKMPGDVAVDENNYSLMAPPPPPFPLPLPPLRAIRGTKRVLEDEEDEGHKEDEEEEEDEEEDDEETCRFTETTPSVQFLGGFQKAAEAKNRRKRPRSLKTTEEVESQRMTHIAVERNRRRQMNEHLRMLRSLMPGSYVQRGDQASIIGGAIEFVRELEQLLQCLESQKRRRLFGGGEAPKSTTDASPLPLPIHQPFFPPLPLPLPEGDHMKLLEVDPNGLREEMVENKSCLADIEVRLLGFDAMIKILSRRRPSQLLKIIAAFEDLQFNILHTNVTTIEQTVLYSFNVKITGETMYTTEDIANFVQQILSFIDANTL